MERDFPPIPVLSEVNTEFKMEHSLKEIETKKEEVLSSKTNLLK